jgi:hypothetical protein
MSNSDTDPREPSPFAPDENDAPRDPKTGKVAIDEPEVAEPSTGDEDVDEASRESFPASDPPSYAGGSGTAGPATPEKTQAGSYARDAEQDPERERRHRADADG